MNKKSKFSTDLETLKQEVEITFYKSSGPGGQRKNKKETAVRIFHPPSGITVIATEHRSQAKNKELAFERLQAKLKKLNKKKKQRKPTKMPRRIKEQILKKKKEQSEKKKMRT
ncbi:peptide chain release factor-like protein, partial [candidate division WOR-3 bacterium]|nr:peptide chain release factor-like protein [candidate division WOR-3 bacterium]